MKRFIVAGLLGVVATCCVDASAGAQAPGGAGGAYAPNFYNRQNQPLSPYLNLLRGGNSAVNYFYGVRPGLMSGGSGPSSVINQGAGRQTFFPQIDTLYDLEEIGKQDGLRPTGHPFGFNNSLGYFGAGSGAGRANPRGQNQGSPGMRRGMLGGR